MGRVLKWIVYLLVFLAILLVLYAYLGPILGVDFSARPENSVEPILLNLE
jgi:hypothetical protein